MKSTYILLMAVFSIASGSVLAQEKAGKKDTTTHPVYYTCPMHPEIMADKPGNCPKCGMKLELSNKEKMKREVTKSYTCPIHADVTSNKPGKCPKCGSDLRLTPKEKMKMQVMNRYSCPMHPDQVSNKQGKCPICGMKMTKEKSRKG